MIYIVAYDIVDDKIRNKISRILGKVGIRLQKSVFSIKCESYKFKKLLMQIERLVKENDSIIVFKLCRGCERNSIYVGEHIKMIYVF